MRQSFVNEARSAASLRHPNVASVFHLGKSGNNYFYAMEFVEGEPLDRVLRFRGPLDVNLALEIVDQVAAALSAAYRTNLVHRDIKPANLMVVFGDGGTVTVKVIDFGLAKAQRAPTSHQGSFPGRKFVGTPQFASAEQCAGKEPDIRSDLYSLGVTLWVMLTGKVPFEGTVSEVLEKQQHEAPPFEQLEHVPKPVCSLLESLLEKEPSDRPQTPFELRNMVRKVRDLLGAERPLAILPWKGIQITQKRYRPRRRIVILVVSLSLGITAMFTYFLHQKFSPHIDAKSVAVLPFNSSGENKENDYFGDGLTTDVIFELSKISDLRVISRDSVFRYKAQLESSHKTLDQIGEELQVSAILESSVERLENRVKIVSIMYDARSGKRLWGESYDREIKDLFAIQSDVAENIAAALQVRLSAKEQTNLQSRPTENLTAYDLYLRGMAMWELRHKDDNERAIALFKRALEQDPKFTLGYVGLANSYIERNIRFDGEPFWLDSAIDLCRQAEEIDPNQARSYIVHARAFACKNMPNQAAELVKKALQLAPNDAEANFRAASQLPTIDPEGYALLRKSHALSPNDPRVPYLLAQTSAILGERNLMEKWMQQAINLESDPERHRMLELERLIFRGNAKGAISGLKQLDPSLVTYGNSVLVLLVTCLERVKDWSEALRLANSDLEKSPNDPWAIWHIAMCARALGRESEGIEEAKRLVNLEKDAFKDNPQDISAGFYLAFGYRLQGQEEDSYVCLRAVFPEIIDDLPFFWGNPALDLFAEDRDFRLLTSEFATKSEDTRARIRQIERDF